MSKKQENIALVWFRNDLRVEDNNVLKCAVDHHQSLIAVYCFDPRHFEVDHFGFKKTEKYRAKFLIESLFDLKENLKKYNIELLVYHRHPEDVVPELVETHSIKNIYYQKEWTREETNVEENLKDKLPKLNFHAFYDQFLFHPDDVDIEFENIPQVFTQFRKKVEKYSKVRTAVKIETAPKQLNIDNETSILELSNLGLDNFDLHPNTAIPFSGGETSAKKRLDEYIFNTKKLGVYKKTRNGLVGKNYSSKFSIWLANGSLSPRTVYWAVKQFEENEFSNQSTYWMIFELIWRDYFKYISLKHCDKMFQIGGILEKDYDWKTNKNNIQNWINGETKSDFVNANMIEIKKTGFMSNRGRQNVASFFAKELMLDWRIGAAYFESLLVDYDVHSNYGNWMYNAGVGNDPRDRKFNVESQADRYDSNGEYRRLWLQETLF